MRVGLGIDAHRLVEGRALVLGGLEIPYRKGLGGHSDADALLHAIMDALLGASGGGDIGSLFPDDDPKYRDAASADLLARVLGVVEGRGFEVGNVDVVVIAQEPKLSPYREEMRERIAGILGVPVSAVGVKATTSEGMGFTGRGEGIMCMAVALLRPTGSK